MATLPLRMHDYGSIIRYRLFFFRFDVVLFDEIFQFWVPQYKIESAAQKELLQATSVRHGPNGKC